MLEVTRKQSQSSPNDCDSSIPPASGAPEATPTDPPAKRQRRTKAEMAAFCTEQEKAWLLKEQEREMAKLLKDQERRSQTSRQR